MRLQELFAKDKVAMRPLLPLVCCICLFTKEKESEEQPLTPADTIICGHAVCLEHVFLVRDNTFIQRIEFAKGEAVT